MPARWPSLKRKLLYLLCCCSSIAWSQHTSVTIVGGVTAAPGSYVVIQHSDHYILSQWDTLRLQQGGCQWSPGKLTSPKFITIQFADKKRKKVFVYPGYSLRVEQVDGKYVYQGKGAKANQLLDSIAEKAARYSFSTGQALSFDTIQYKIEQHYRYKQSLIEQLLTSTTEPDIAFLRRLEIYGVQYGKVGAMLNLLSTKGADSARRRSVYARYVSPAMLKISDSTLFTSKEVCSFFVTFHEVFLDNRDNKGDRSKGINTYEHKIARAAREYEGLERDLVIFKMTELAFYFADVLPGETYFDMLVDSACQLFHSKRYAFWLKELYEKWKPDIRNASVAYWKGKPAPSFIAVDTVGKTFSLSSFSGKVLLVSVWASWCGPCIANFPAVDSLHQLYKNDSNVVLCKISIDEFRDKWVGALKRYQPAGLQLWVPADSLPAFRKAYGAQAIPLYFLVGKGGHFAFKTGHYTSLAAMVEEIERQKKISL